MYVVNTNKIPHNIGSPGTKFWPGIFFYPQYQLDNVTKDPNGRADWVGGDRLPTFENLEAIESNYDADTLIDLVNKSVESLRGMGRGSATHFIDKLQELRKMPNETVRAYIVEQLKALAEGRRPSIFQQFQGSPLDLNI